MIRMVSLEDAPALTEIYNPYVLNTTITFEKTPITAVEMAQRIKKVLDASLPWLVLEDNGCIQGYAYATPWRERVAYKFSVESSVYLDAGASGKGYGLKLYTELLSYLRAHSFHAVMGGITDSNEASIALHEKLGFQKVAHFKEVGWKFDQWIDVGYWELIL